MQKFKIIPLVAILLTIVALAQPELPPIDPNANIIPGTKASVLYGNAYPNAIVGKLYPDHWPFGGIAPDALVAIGSPVYGDFYNLTNQMRYLLGITTKQELISKYPNSRMVLRDTRGAAPGIGIGFTALGEFAAVLNNGIGGGLAIAPYNRPDVLSLTETWATNNIGYINPSDWLNGWTLSANLTLRADDVQQYYYIFIHAFAVYSNRTTAGGGRGVAVNVTKFSTPQSNYYPSKWKVIPFTSNDFSPIQVLYDSPRLLIARGSVKKVVDLGDFDPNLVGASVKIVVNWTLVFPKAWNYAIVYYNYSITAEIASKLLPYPLYLNRTAFSIRFEIDQVNKGPDALTLNATIFTTNTCVGDSYNLLQATPQFMRNITMFAAVYPTATEYTPDGLTYLVPYITNNFKIVLPTGYKQNSVASKIPFVIFQWSKDFGSSGKAIAGSPYTYNGGVMFVYGYAYNITDWVNAKSPDPYIAALLNRTVFNPPTLAQLTQCQYGGTLCNVQFSFKYGVVGSLADPTDVLSAAYVAMYLRPMYMALDIAPNAFQNLYTGQSTGGMTNFVGLWNFGGLPHILANVNQTFPYFYDKFLRFSIDRESLTFDRLYTSISPAAGTAVFTVGGPYVNMLTRYVQDFAWYVPFVSTYSDAPYPFKFDKYYKSSPNNRVASVVWNNLIMPSFNTTWPPRNGARATGLAVVSTAVDPNGTVILQVWGMNTQDTYWASYLLSTSLNQFVNAPAYIILIDYNTYQDPPGVRNVNLPMSYRIISIWTYKRPVTGATSTLNLPAVTQGLTIN
ncbi:hypothetical protein [Pyrobaculum sp.]|uniref:hypothetical protein n=1 Tax=Pyrobaculum sp. TaxID=2004705 RepID=UPI0031751FCA